MSRKERHTKRLDRVVLRMMKGDTLHCETSPDGLQWWLEPSGKSVGPVTASKVIALPAVQQQGDCLFDSQSQSYRYVTQG